MKLYELRNLIKEEIKRVLKEGSIKDILTTFQEALESNNIPSDNADITTSSTGSNYLILKGMKMKPDQMKKVAEAFNQNSEDVQIHDHKLKGNNTVFTILIGSTDY